MIFKRGRIYWYQFVFEGQRIRQSTRQGNDLIAERAEAAHKTRLADEARARKQKAIELDCQPETLVRCSECEQLFRESKAIRQGGLQFCSEECAKQSAKRQRPVPTLTQFID